MTITDLFVGPLSTFADISNYNGEPLLRKETDDAHSFWVALYAMILGHEYAQRHLPNAEYPRLEKLLPRALCHDLDEIESTDIPFRLKTNFLTKEEINRIHVTSLQRLEKNMSEHAVVHGSDMTVTELICYALDAKDDTFEGRLVAFADKFARTAFFVKSARMGNKRAAELAVKQTTEVIKKQGEEGNEFAAFFLPEMILGLRAVFVQEFGDWGRALFQGKVAETSGGS